jgi:hypothetical protein
MFFDKGRGGYYHNVTGLGVKQYGPLEYENRLLCGLMDAAFAPKILFKPTTQEAATKFQLARFGQWGLVPPGTDVVQTPIQGLMQDGLAMFRTSSDLMRSNLSQYRQTVEPDKPGNPDTATEARMKMSQGGALSNTTFNRYYHQRDLLLSEIVRRACNLNSTDTRAKEFQDRCRRRGVPDECFGRIESVQAVRVVGQGSPFMRREVTQAMLPLMMRLPESGQQNLLDDFISSNAGQSAVNRYNPRSKISAVSGDQKERAGNQVTGMHSGKPADFSPSQDALIFSAVYMQAAVQAMQSVQNGGNPQQVLAFVELAGAAAAKQIRRLSGDPLRQQIGKEFEKQLKQLGNQVDRLKKLMQQQAQQRQKQGQKTAQVMSDIQLRQLETQAKIQDRNLKTRFALQDKAVRSRQQMAINDSQSASQIAINHYRALSE